VAPELAVTAADLSGWRDAFLDGGSASLKTRRRDARDEIDQLRTKVGELAMDTNFTSCRRRSRGWRLAAPLLRCGGRSDEHRHLDLHGTPLLCRPGPGPEVAVCCAARREVPRQHRRDQRPLPIRHVACIAPARAQIGHIVAPTGRHPPPSPLPATTANQADGGRSTPPTGLLGQVLKGRSRKCRLLLPGACEPRQRRLSPWTSDFGLSHRITRRREPEHSCRWQLFAVSR
jgi:hypothetical protein